MGDTILKLNLLLKKEYSGLCRAMEVRRLKSQIEKIKQDEEKDKKKVS